MPIPYHINITITILIIFLPVFQDEFLAAVDGAVAVHHHHRGWKIKQAGGQHKQPKVRIK